MVTLEAVVDPAAHEPAAELGERPAELGALADARGPMLERDQVRRQLLEARQAEARLRAEHDFRGAGEERLRSVTRRAFGRHELLHDRRVGTLAEPDERAGQQRAIPLAEHPADDDRVLELDPCGHVDHEPLRPGGPGQLGELVVGGQRVRSGQQVAHRVEVVVEEANGHAGAARGIGQLDRDVATLDDLGDGIGALGQLVPCGGRRSVDRERGVGQLGEPQVDVRRVQTVRLAGQRFVLLEGGAPVVGEPGGFVGSDAVDVLRGDDESEVVERPAHRPLPRSRRGPFGRCRLPGRGRHPSDPSISSFTSRLNSIAYSMGSSLVKTSRKPWTIRFVASFSVRPRLIR